MDELENLLKEMQESREVKRLNLSQMIFDSCRELSDLNKNMIFDQADLYEIEQSMEFTKKDVDRAVYKYFYPGK